MGGDPRRARAAGATGRTGPACRTRRALGACARDPGRAGAGDERRRQQPRRSQGAADASATYDFAIHTHGSMGPSCAVAEFKDGKLTTWSASQATHNLRKQLAHDARHAGRAGALRLHRRRRLLRPQRARGRGGRCRAAGPGGRPAGARAMDARGRTWLGPEGPAAPGGLARRRSTRRATSWRGRRRPSSRGRRRQCGPDGGGTGRLPRENQIHPGNIIHNSALPYAFPAIKTTCHRLDTTPFRPSWIRTPGRMQNTYANEAFLDECAAAANADPVEYRLRVMPATTRAGGRCWNAARACELADAAIPAAGQSGDILRAAA